MLFVMCDCVSLCARCFVCVVVVCGVLCCTVCLY